jgi:secretion/DNA translocation related TadE-like protein
VTRRIRSRDGGLMRRTCSPDGGLMRRTSSPDGGLTRRTCSPDGGSASVWVIACAALVLLIATVGVIRGTAVVARHRAEGAADLAALAAAARIGMAADDPGICRAAGPIASANGATLTSCAASVDASGRSGTVVVRVEVTARLPGWGQVRTTASAKAGRLP